MKCQMDSSQTQRAGIPPGETQEVQGWVAHHSAQSIQAEAQYSPGTPKTLGKRTKWPTATDKKA